MKKLLTIALLLSWGAALAHSGGTDANGCHTNRKTGDYHCHNSKNKAPQEDQAAKSTAAPKAATTPSGATCYVGPRGGTYTITASGRKNYSGC
jgi:hypothetical protein